MGFLFYFATSLIDIFFPCMTGGMGLEIWLTARIRNYLSRYVVGGSRHVGGIGLMLAAISWTDRADWHGVFVSGSSERESVGLQQLLQPNPALLFSQGLRGTCEGCQLSIVCSAGTGRQKERVWFFFFLCRKVHFSGIPLFLVFKWRLAIILLSLFLPPYSLSALLSFFLCYKLWGMRRERGKIKANPHTLPSNIIRLSLMALLEFLPCTCVWFCVHVQCYPCLFYAFACLSLSFSVHMCACTLTFGCTCSHYVQCFPLAWGPVLPLGRHAISPCILSKTSKLPFSEVHVGAAHCLMSLLFCWALS